MCVCVRGRESGRKVCKGRNKGLIKRGKGKGKALKDSGREIEVVLG